MAENWIRVVDQVVRGDRLAYLRLARLVTGQLHHWRAYDFRDEWDDLIQETVLASVQAVQEGRLRDPAALPAYVRAVAHNKFVNWLRRGGREVVVSDPDERLDAISWPPEEIDETGRIEERIEIWGAVAELPEKQRTAITQVYREGRTQQEAARETGIPLGSLKRYLREGLSALHERLGESRAQE